MAYDYHSTGYGTSGDDSARQAYFAKNGYDAGQQNTYESKFGNAASDFAAQFQQLVGRAPTSQEVSSYMGQVVGGSGLDAFSNNRGLELSQLGANYIGSRYADDANQIAQQKLQDQQGQANSLADLFRSQGNTAIDGVQNSLLDFQSKLFDKIRPNLITSLQAQGLLNSGAVNQSMAGAAQNLADASSSQIANLRYQNDQGANAIAFGGASAPYQFQQQQILNHPANMASAANTGLQNAYGTMTNQLNFQNQAALQQQQFYQQAALNAKNSHGFFGQVGSAFAPALGTSLGTNLGSWVMPGAQGQTNSAGAAQAAPLASLFAA